jgi:hypothetical protein
MSTLSGACVLCVLVPHLMGQLGAAMIVSKLKGARQRKRATGVKVEGRKSYGEADRSRATVERAKALKVEGLTLRQVAERLASEGYQTSAGTPYQFTAVGRMTPMWHHSRADEGNRYGRLRREVGQPALVLARTWEKRSVICRPNRPAATRARGGVQVGCELFACYLRMLARYPEQCASQATERSRHAGRLRRPRRRTHFRP